MSPAPSPDRVRVLRRKIQHRLLNMERHRDALEHTLAEIDEEGGREAFVEAASSDEPRSLARVYMLERPFEVVQNYLAELVRFGLELAGLTDRSEPLNAPRDFARLRDAGVISQEQCERLIDLQRARNAIAHEYGEAEPEEAYDAAQSLIAALPTFMSAYGPWLKTLPGHTTPETLRGAWADVAPGRDLTDELIAERHEEARREEERHNE